MYEIDARGKACPLPVVLAKKALDAGERDVTVLVDNAVAVENLRRLAAASGRAVHSDVRADGFAVTLTGGDGAASAAAECACAAPAPAGASLALFVGREGIGSGNAELGRNLMRMFFLTLAEGDTVPESILFMNGGVQLPVEDDQIVESLAALAARGAAGAGPAPGAPRPEAGRAGGARLNRRQDDLACGRAVPLVQARKSPGLRLLRGRAGWGAAGEGHPQGGPT